MLPCSPRRRWRHSGSPRTCLDTQNRACKCEEAAAGRGGWRKGRLSRSWSSGFQLLQTHNITPHNTRKQAQQGECYILSFTSLNSHRRETWPNMWFHDSGTMVWQEIEHLWILDCWSNKTHNLNTFSWNFNRQSDNLIILSIYLFVTF